MTTTNLQQKLFDIILQKFPKRAQAAESLQTLLGLGRDAIYRRFRGETPLTPDELQLLAREFDISLDALIFGQADQVFFSYRSFPSTLNKFQDYLEEVHRNISTVYQLEGSRIYYTTAELPIYHYCALPEIIAFKLYVWARTVWNFEDWNGRKFQFSDIPTEAIQLSQEIVRLYYNIPSTELWHLNILDNTLNQMEYYVSSGGFIDPNDAFVLCDKLLSLVNYIDQMAEAGHKFAIGKSPAHSKGAELDLYYNEMMFTSNTILADTPMGKTVFATYGSPNFLRCTNPRMGDYTEDWIKRIIRKSISISAHEEKNRIRFFNKLRRKVEQSRQRIKGQIELLGLG